MKFEIRNRPDYASLHLLLDQGEQIKAEPGAMMGKSPAMELQSAASGGLLKSLKRMAGGESFIINTFTSTGPEQRLDLAPASPGDLIHIPLNGSPIMTQSGAFCASTSGVEVDSKWGGARGFFSGTGLFLLKCSGQGDLFLNSYGAIECREINGSYVVDTSHIVAFDASINYRVRREGSWKSFLFGGEGLVCEFNGRGRVWFQTRNSPALLEFLHPFRPVESND